MMKLYTLLLTLGIFGRLVLGACALNLHFVIHVALFKNHKNILLDKNFRQFYLTVFNLS